MALKTQIRSCHCFPSLFDYSELLRSDIFDIVVISEQAQTGEHSIDCCTNTWEGTNSEVTEVPRSVYAMHKRHTKKQRRHTSVILGSK